MISKVS